MEKYLKDANFIFFKLRIKCRIEKLETGKFKQRSFVSRILDFFIEFLNIICMKVWPLQLQGKGVYQLSKYEHFNSIFWDAVEEHVIELFAINEFYNSSACLFCLFEKDIIKLINCNSVAIQLQFYWKLVQCSRMTLKSN